MFLKNCAGKVRGHTNNFYEGLRYLGEFDPVLKEALFKGLALYSPDDLSYLLAGRSLHRADAQPEFDSYLNYLNSTYQLMKYRLFASLSANDRWSESIFQVVLATANFAYELLKALQALVRTAIYLVAAVLCLFTLNPAGVMGFAFGVIYPIGDFIKQLFLIIPAACLFIAGMFGVVTRNILSINAADKNPVEATEETIQAICANVGGNNSDLIANRISALNSDHAFFNGRTDLERIIDKPLSFPKHVKSLFSKKFHLLYKDDAHSLAWPLVDLENHFRLIW